jgi:hypothetical protein
VRAFGSLTPDRAALVAWLVRLGSDGVHGDRLGADLQPFRTAWRDALPRYGAAGQDRAGAKKRHPLYNVGMLLYGSLTLLTGLWWLGVGLRIPLSVLLWRTPREEDRLIDAFGEEYRPVGSIKGANTLVQAANERMVSSRSPWATIV